MFLSIECIHVRLDHRYHQIYVEQRSTEPRWLNSSRVHPTPSAIHHDERPKINSEFGARYGMAMTLMRVPMLAKKLGFWS